MGIALVCFFPFSALALVHLYFLMSVHSTTLASNSARYCPRQFLGPCMNGRNLNPSFSLKPGSVNRSGLYTSGSGQRSSLW